MDNTKFGSSAAAAMGGKARAQRLTPEERSAIAALGGAARAEKAGKPGLPKATHSGPLRLGDMEFECSVVTDGERIIRLVSETNLMEQMGMYRSGALSTRRKRNDAGAQ